MTRMIYHVPYPLKTDAKTGSGLRPVRMLEAFRAIGYDVEVVAGVSKERRKLIRDLKRRIRGGEKFDFLYSESHTMPTALTDPDHLPRHPLMDVAFMRFCRKNGTKVGLFYRDIYWRFPAYKEAVNAIVRTGTRLLYNMDLVAYRLAVDKLYLPSLGMGKFVTHVPAERFAALPPGGEIRDLSTPTETSESSDLELFYVGGIGGYYRMHDTVRAVAASESSRLTICTTEAEWAVHGAGYQGIMNDRITVIHKNGADLEPYYARAAACMLFIEPSVYRSFAAPIKFAEYIGFGKPVIVNAGTNVAEFVAKFGNGWVLPFDSDALSGLLNDLALNPLHVAETTGAARKIREANTWEARARQVAADLGRFRDA